jgi:hypothetical protein
MPQKVTVDDMVQAIRQADKPVTAREIAEACDVTRQTISNYRDDLEEDGRIEHGKVGTATAYWLAEEDGSVNTRPPGDGPRQGRRDGTPDEPAKRESADSQEDETGSQGFIQRLFASDGMDLPGVMLILLLVAVVGFAALQVLSGAYKLYKSKTVVEGWRVDVAAVGKILGLVFGALAFSLVTIAAGVVLAWVAWTYHPLATVVLVALLIAARVVEFRALRTGFGQQGGAA